MQNQTYIGTRQLTKSFLNPVTSRCITSLKIDCHKNISLLDFGFNEDSRILLCCLRRMAFPCRPIDGHVTRTSGQWFRRTFSKNRKSEMQMTVKRSTKDVTEESVTKKKTDYNIPSEKPLGKHASQNCEDRNPLLGSSTSLHSKIFWPRVNLQM